MTNNSQTLTQLAIKYYNTKHKKFLNKIMQKAQPFVRILTLRIVKKTKNIESFDDFMGYGLLGLWSAAETFDPSYNTKFETFAAYKIIGKILDEQRKPHRKKTKPKITKINNNIQSNDQEPLQELLNKELREIIRKDFKDIPEKYHKFLEAYILQGETLMQASEKIPLSSAYRFLKNPNYFSATRQYIKN